MFPDSDIVVALICCTVALGAIAVWAVILVSGRQDANGAMVSRAVWGAVDRLNEIATEAQAVYRRDWLYLVERLNAITAAIEKAKPQATTAAKPLVIREQPARLPDLVNVEIGPGVKSARPPEAKPAPPRRPARPTMAEIDAALAEGRLRIVPPAEAEANSQVVELPAPPAQHGLDPHCAW